MGTILGSSKQRRNSPHIELWELMLAKKVARAFRTNEREDLEAELAKKLLELKSGRLPRIHNWPAYLATFLYHRAANWIRDARARERREILASQENVSHVEESYSEGFPSEMDHILNDLSPELRAFWLLLAEKGGNRSAVARQMGIHRNTVRLWIKKIRSVLQARGMAFTGKSEE
jgi:DNA-directed RNA polymerase specialized sigma24 family protein